MGSSANIRSLGLAFALAGLATSACSDPTQLLIEIHTDLPPGEQTLMIAQAQGVDNTSGRHEFNVNTSDFPVSFGLRAKDSAASGPVDLGLELQRGGQVIARARRRVLRWLPNEKGVVQLCLNTKCVEASCDNTTSCGNQGCVDLLIEPLRLADPTFACGSGRRQRMRERIPEQILERTLRLMPAISKTPRPKAEASSRPVLMPVRRIPEPTRGPRMPSTGRSRRRIPRGLAVAGFGTPTAPRPYKSRFGAHHLRYRSEDHL